MMKTDSFSIFSDYGMIKERFCAMTTDALRAKLLEYSGYQAEICEFIDFENSPKNLLIRAKRTGNADRLKYAKIKNQIESIKNEFGITITLEKLLLEMNAETN